MRSQIREEPNLSGGVHREEPNLSGGVHTWLCLSPVSWVSSPFFLQSLLFSAARFMFSCSFLACPFLFNFSLFLSCSYSLVSLLLGFLLPLWEGCLSSFPAFYLSPPALHSLLASSFLLRKMRLVPPAFFYLLFYICFLPDPYPLVLLLPPQPVLGC